MAIKDLHVVIGQHQTAGREVLDEGIIWPVFLGFCLEETIEQAGRCKCYTFMMLRIFTCEMYSAYVGFFTAANFTQLFFSDLVFFVVDVIIIHSCLSGKLLCRHRLDSL